VTKKQDIKSGPHDDRMIGRTLGDYTLTRVLATGGMARIYEGVDNNLKRPAAVKVLEQEKLAADETLTRRFDREARAVAALDHDNIITIYQYGEQDGVYFLAMKLIKGKDLSQELSRLKRAGQKMEVVRGLKILEQVASALDYAHQANIIHRDVKPSNILLTANDRAVLTDFGLVLQPSIETTMGTAFGTPRYIAPEQAIASNKALPQSDIYSLAVILFEILTGQTPFTGDSPMEIALSHISDPPPTPRSLNREIPEGANRAILQALEKEPEKRQESATEFITSVKAAYGLSFDPWSSTSGSLSSITNSRPLQKDNGASQASSKDELLSDWDDWKPADTPVPKRRGKGRPVLIFLLLIILLVGGGFLAFSKGLIGSHGPNNGTPGVGVVVNNPTGASITLIYDDSNFTMYNGGDYTVNVLPMQFIRGTDGGQDDYVGDRVPGDSVASHTCYRILLQRQGTQPSIPDVCTNEGQRQPRAETLTDPSRFFWRREPVSADYFEVWYNKQVIVRCPTVARGESNECQFNWPTNREAPTGTPST
jgi:serine/threonine protein kinase